MTTAAGPLGAKILTEEATVEALGQQVQALQESVAADQTLTNQAYTTWQTAVATQNTAQNAVSKAATQAYEQQLSLGPYAQYGSTIRGLGLIAPGLVSPPPTGESTAVTLAQDRLVAASAFTAYEQALTAQQELQGQVDDMQATFTKKSDSLDKLKAQNQLAVAEAQAAQDASDASNPAGADAGSNSLGQAANPKALAALQFALKQLGKPYVFGAEGPNSFDCSGLTWDSYRSVGVTIPRIAAYQEHALTPVSVDEMLPGDLIFFSGTNSTAWQSVSHVGMYYGKSASGTALMIEAPHTGDNVKIAPVWWSHFYSVGRPVPAVNAPPQATPTPTPTPTPSPSHSPSPSPSPSHSKSPSPSPSPSHSASPSPSPSPSPSDSPSPSPSPSTPATSATTSPTEGTEPSPSSSTTTSSSAP